MKNLFFVFTVCLMLFLGVTACNPCKNVDCANGTCDATSGDCNCNVGYETDTDGKCSVEIRAKYLGNWTGDLTYTGAISGSQNQTLVITNGNAINKITINNLMTCNSVSVPITALVFTNAINDLDAVDCGTGNISFNNSSITVSGNTMAIFVNYSISSAGAVVGSGNISGTLTK